MLKTEPTTGICGYGMVGTQVAKYLAVPKYLIYDPPKGFKSKETFDADIIFMSVYIMSNGYNDKDRDLIRELLSMCKDGAIVVSKMTTYPGFTKEIAKEFPKLKIVHNPEFLTEANAYDNFIDPDLQILGGTKGMYQDDYKVLLDVLPGAKIDSFTTDSTTSELIKLTINGFYATKNSYFNAIYDLAEHSNSNYEHIRRAVSEAMGIGDIHTQIWHKGGRGYAGKCLPKDVRCLISAMDGVTDMWQSIDIAAKINDGLIQSFPKKNVQ